MSGTLGLLMDGLAVAGAPQNLAFALGGAVLGTAVGVLPGLGPAMTISLLRRPATHDSRSASRNSSTESTSWSSRSRSSR